MLSFAANGNALSLRIGFDPVSSLHKWTQINNECVKKACITLNKVDKDTTSAAFSRIRNQ